MVEDNEHSTPWKNTMINAIRRQYGIRRVVGKGGVTLGWVTVSGDQWEPMSGLWAVRAEFLFARMAGEAVGPYPASGGYGDLDKLTRNLGDALEQSGLIVNDREIVRWDVCKEWWNHSCVKVRMDDLSGTH